MFNFSLSAIQEGKMDQAMTTITKIVSRVFCFLHFLLLHWFPLKRLRFSQILHYLFKGKIQFVQVKV